MKQIIDRLTALRDLMKKNGVSACIIPGTDPHASEYFAEYWKERVWISGFNGSAGTAVVTLESAALWTDSRYFLQGAEQLVGTTYELMKQGLPETLDINPWLGTQLKAGEKVGVNAQMFSYNAYQSMKKELSLYGIELVSIDLMALAWTERPALPLNPFFVYDVKLAGQSTKDKLNVLRKEVKKAHANVVVLSALDDIAWLFNIRGNDVDFNPVTIAYALVDEDKATLFINPEKVTAESALYLKQEGVDVAPYLGIYDALKAIDTSKAVYIDGAKLNESLFEAIPSACVIRNSMSPVFKLKAVKNEVELSGVNCAMQKDGVAMVRFLKWLDENVGKIEMSEISISDKLHDFRAAQENFVGESFATISGYAAHGAIVHYSATPESNSKVTNENILLLDSGGQYLEGTTDITRTIALGTPTPEQIHDNTLVLKGHIGIATAIFPYGTRGSQLDILARKALWDDMLNYGHGTGHGVGHFLNVHEGPQNIRMDENPVILQQGMIISNEPGMYRSNGYGIRIENLVTVVPAGKTEFGLFLKFETLTYCPIDTRLVDANLLTESELKWFNDYQAKVFEVLSPNLSAEESKWLETKCKAISK